MELSPAMKRTFLALALQCIPVLLVPGTAVGQVPTGDGKIAKNMRGLARVKDPKLSSLLLPLAESVPQQQRPSTSGPKSESRLSVENLPASIRDAISAGRMHVTQNGEILVYITVQIVGEPAPHKAKGEVLTAVPTVQALLPATMIRQTESLVFVSYIRLPDYAVRNTGSVDSQGDSILEADVVRSTFGLDGTRVRVGVISDGIGGIFATGCTTCGATSAVPSPIVLGDLPNATGTRDANGVLISVTGGITAQSFNADGNLEACLGTCDTTSNTGAEGTAMLEIVHDLAPGAQLYFANGDTSMAFEEAVDFLAANTDVVVSDISYFTPPFDGTSAVSATTSNALNDNANPIRAYFTSVGNYAQNHFEGAFVGSGMDGTTITGQLGDLHLFEAVPNAGPFPTTDNAAFGAVPFDPVVTLPPGKELDVYLAWNDPTAGSTNDYDLFLVPLNCSGTNNGLPVPPCTISGPPVASSTNLQSGTQDPTESLTWINHGLTMAVVGIVIQNVKNGAAVRTLDLFVHGYQDKRSSANHNFNTVSGSVPAVSDAGGTPASVVSVGAIDESQCASPGNCAGLLELFSSQGPTQATPQAPFRIKPDLVALDEVCVTGAGGFGNGPATNCPPSTPTSYMPQKFGGTSAAAPHAAAIAALTLQSAPCLSAAATNPQTPGTSRANLRQALISNAIALPGVMETIPNNIEGNGLVNALDSVKSMLPTANAGSTQTVNATSSSGASVVLTASGSDPNSCPLVGVAWTGGCGNGTVSGLRASLSCPIGINTVELSVSNNNISYSQPDSQPFTVIVTDFLLSTSPAANTVSPGNPALYAITAASTAQGAFSNPISLACSSGLPANAVCSFSPTSVTVGSSSAVSNLTIYTSNPSSSIPDGPWKWPFRSPWIWSAVLVLLAGLAIFARSREKEHAFRVALCTFLVFAAAFPIGCGSYNTTPTSKTYTVTITGTANELKHSTTLSLTIQ
jgi:hypothetical protein